MKTMNVRIQIANVKSEKGFPLRNLHQLLYVFTFLIIFSACDPSFQPLEANDEFFFSMYGFLDAGADTQWVHITPIREQVDLLSDGIRHPGND